MTDSLQVLVRENSGRLGIDLAARQPSSPFQYLGRLDLFRLPIGKSERDAFWARLPQRFEAFADRFPDLAIAQDDLCAVIEKAAAHVGAPSEAEAAQVMKAISTPSEQRALAREIRQTEVRLAQLKHGLSGARS